MSAPSSQQAATPGQPAPGSGDRPPRAVVGSQVSFEEEMFAAAFDGVVVRRFWEFVSPYRKSLWIGIGAVMVFILTQLAIPLVVRAAIDDAILEGASATGLLHLFGGLFLVVVCVNYAANIVQELIVGRVAG